MFFGARKVPKPVLSAPSRGRRDPVTRALWAITVLALAALAAWPAYVARLSRDPAAPVFAGVTTVPDFERREKLIAFWEGAVRQQLPNDMLSPRELAGQYLARYRERGDVDDVVRAQRMARRSLAIQPRSPAALAQLASVMLTLHRFRAALACIDAALKYVPENAELLAQRASLEMELGRYAAARATLQRIAPHERTGIAATTTESRYDELTGRLAGARTLLENATALFDATDSTPSQARAWYRFRAGELAFEAGENETAIEDERAALAIFPTYNLALKDLAKFSLANHRYAEALAAARAGASVTPFPETLGYEADAQGALGDAGGAAATRDLIFAIDRLGNAYHLSDRLLAVYYADHGVRRSEALAVARREAALRGDEIYAQDTLAWAAAMDGRWREARIAAARALRFDTQDATLQYHAGVIALHFRDEREGVRRLRRALALNPHFHAAFAAEAARLLARHHDAGT